MALPPLRLLQATTFVSTMDRFAMPPMLLVTARSLGVPLSSVVQTAVKSLGCEKSTAQESPIQS